jgi:hypothetical protein
LTKHFVQLGVLAQDIGMKLIEAVVRVLHQVLDDFIRYFAVTRTYSEVDIAV